MVSGVSRWVGSAALAVVVATLGLALASSQAASRADLDQRFAARADLSSRFVSSYTADVLTRERLVAEARLAAPSVTASEFSRVTEDLGFEAAVLLDERGRLLQVVPSNPGILGTTLAPRYAHLTSAVAGHVAISGVVPGAATGRPVVAFATPFDTLSGRRVFSGAFDIGKTPLGSYLQDALPYRGATADLMDPSGKLVATSRTASRPGLSGTDARLAVAVAGGSSGSFTDGGRRRHFVSVRPGGTPWTLISSVPEASLYSPLGTLAIVMPWVVLLGLALAGALVLLLVIRLGESRERLAEASLTDPLTGLPNRRAWDAGSTREVARAARLALPLCISVMDLDHFKAYNDKHGHGAGDALLAAAATAWTSQLREGDLLARIGGEEFGLVLPGTDAATAHEVIERLRGATPSGRTVSAGCVAWNGNESAQEALARADRCLYLAKGAGRNRSVIGA